MRRSRHNTRTLFISMLGALILGLIFALPPTSSIPSASVSAAAATACPVTKSHLVPVQGGRWFLAGVNVPWQNGGFGADFATVEEWGQHTYTHAATDAMFAALQASGVNTVRWWVFADGRGAPEFTATSGGAVSGLDANTLPSMADAITLAAQHNIRIVFNLWSFDMLMPDSTATAKGEHAGGHTDLITDATKRSSFLTKALQPMLAYPVPGTSYTIGNHPNVLGWDIFNEPEFAISDLGAVNAGINPVTLAQMRQFVAETAGTIHRNSNQLVTVGSAALKWSSATVLGATGNIWTDAALTPYDAQGNLDFYQVHYYTWMNGDGVTWNYSPLASSWAVASFDKPTVIGELPANPTGTGYTAGGMLDQLHTNCYGGSWAWSYEGVDGAGTWADTSAALKTFTTANAAEVNIPAGSTSPTATPVAPTATAKPATATATSVAPTATAKPATATATSVAPTATAKPATATATSVAPTATAKPATATATSAAPTATAKPATATATSVAPTATAKPATATATSVAPTATAKPATATATSVAPTATAKPATATATSVAPTATAKPATATPVMPTPDPAATRVADLSFQFNKDNYQFTNWGIDSQSSNDLTVADLRALFGDSAVCRTTPTATIPCRVRSTALAWLAQVNGYLLQGGHGDGFTITALRFFKSIDTPATFQTGTTNTHDLLFASARRNITKYEALQLPVQGAAARADALQNTPSVVVDQIIAAIKSAADPTTLLIYNADRTSGHSVLPYAVDKIGDLFKIYVYDSNWPNDSARFVEVNKATNTWSYDLGGGRLWSGTATSQSLGAVPISVYAQTPSCPWCASNGRPGKSDLFQFWLRGHGHLLITNKSGKRIGYANKSFVNEITDGFAAPPAGGLDTYNEPIYYLPSDDYQIDFDGKSLNLAQTTSNIGFSQVGPNFSVGVANLSLDATSSDSLKIAKDGTQVSYTANQSRSVDLNLSYNGASTSSGIELNGFDVGAGKLLTVQAQTVSNTVTLSNTGTTTGSYNLTITVVTPTGEGIFQNNNITFTPGSIQTLNFTNLANGADTVALSTDTNGDGTIDSTVNLPNQVTRIFIPVILR